MISVEKQQLSVWWSDMVWIMVKKYINFICDKQINLYWTLSENILWAARNLLYHSPISVPCRCGYLLIFQSNHLSTLNANICWVKTIYNRVKNSWLVNLSVSVSMALWKNIIDDTVVTYWTKCRRHCCKRWKEKLPVEMFWYMWKFNMVSHGILGQIVTCENLP